MQRAFWYIPHSLPASQLASFAHAADYFPPAAPLKGFGLPPTIRPLTARAGESTTVKLQLQNTGLPPESVALSVPMCRRAGRPCCWAVARPSAPQWQRPTRA